MKFTFIGNGDDPSEVTVYGITFQLGGPAVEVDDEKIAGKLSTNSHFIEGEADSSAPISKRKPGRPAKKAPGFRQLSDKDLDAE